ncbi:MAG: hypothetical protein WCF12_13150 [Propionicimonas sp.]
MWMLLILAVAVGLGLTRIPDRTALLSMLPVILILVAYQTLKYGLL